MGTVAEVAGAGLGGFAVATTFARHGWQRTMRVHERAPELRMFSAGIWLWEKGLRSLRLIGAEEQAVRDAQQIRVGGRRQTGGEGRWDRGMTLTCRAWSEGRVVLIGDAAHAMAPSLAQGAHMTFIDAVSLAAAVSTRDDVAGALLRWEDREWGLTDHVQRWGRCYGWMVSRWPENLTGARRKFLQFATGFPWVGRQLNRAARHIPAGSES